MSVKVGVRVRPFNQRQIDLNSKLCIDMIGPTTRLFDAEDIQKFRDFTFDYSFWSHDEFQPDQRGYFTPSTQKYADQQLVYQNVGLQILNNAWQGYHCCLFAYGQTGSGKSYSMVGYGNNKGIVPISCEQIFKRIGKNDNPNKQYQVNVSMLQIYNERVQDLLVPISKRLKQGYKIREHKTLGVYVDGLSKHCVDSYQSIQSIMQGGSRNRSIAATQMNASSSRAHTIILIQFKQRQMFQGKKRQKLSVIYLVDLAGSQKVGKTGATGDRLKQAAGINKSLSVLGLVISTLADKAMGKGKNLVVPYRDSCLTRILQNALGGNSKTLMICAISPATDNYEQTLSTLRYADQAKKIQNKAVVNQSQTDKLIRTLKAQKQQLYEKVKKMQQMFAKLQKGLVLPGQMMNQLQQLNQAKQQLRFNSQMMKDMTMTKTQKLKHQKDQQINSQINKFDKSKPHLSNLNEDPQLSRKINYYIDQQQTIIGKRGAQPTNDIEIGGMGIRSKHAVIIKQDDKFYIQALGTSQDSDIYINGQTLIDKRQIFHLDRIAIGANHMFMAIILAQQNKQQIDETKLDWDYAQNQLYLKKQTIQKQLIEQKQRKIKEQTQAILKQKEQELAQLQKCLLQSQEARKNIQQQKQIEKMEMEKKIREQQANRLRLQIQNKKKKMLDTQTQQKQKIKQKYYFQKKLLKTLPKCIQLNLIAKQFKRNISMSVKMMLLDGQGQDGQIDMKKRSIKIKVVNRQVGYTYWWNVDKLSNRYYIIKDMSQTYFQTGIIPILDQKDDPFWDPPQHSLIGRGFLTTKALAYMFDNPVELPIIGQDDHCGQLSVNLVPTDQTGQHNLCQQMDDQDQFQPQQLLDKPFYFNLIIQQAKIPINFENIYVQYSLKLDQINNQTFSTDKIVQRTQNPKFNYIKLHTFKNVSEQILKYLSTAKLIFKIFGYQRIPQEKKQIKKQKQRSNKISNDAKDQQQRQKNKNKKVDSSSVNVLNTGSKTQNIKNSINTGGQTQKKTQVISMGNVPSTTTNKKATPNSNNTSSGSNVIKRGKDDKDCVIY